MALFFKDNNKKHMTENVEKAVFVGIITSNDEESKVMEYLDELEFLAELSLIHI